MKDLARLYERLGLKEDAESLFRGQLPKRLLNQVAANNIDSVSSRQAYGLERIFSIDEARETIQAPRNDDKQRNAIFLETTIQCPSEYIDVVSDAFFCFDGVNMLVADSTEACIRNHSTVNAALLSNRFLAERQSAPTLTGSTLVLAFRNTSNYYHWIHDHLPKFFRLEEAGLDITSIDNVVLDGPISAFQKESLYLLGLSPDQLIELPSGGGLFRCQRLILPKVYNQMGKAQRSSHLEWTFSAYSDAGIDRQFNEPKVLVVRESRGFDDLPYIVSLCQQFGFTPVRPELLNFSQQIALFRQARVIIATHGAALASLAFCQRGATIHEFYGEHVHPCFWRIADACGLNYHNYNCSQVTDSKTVTSNRNARDRKNQNLSVDPERLESTFRDCVVS